MKKLLTLALVGAMLSATGITAFAAPITADSSDPKTGGTNVTYEVAPVYTVVIPESVTLGDTAVTEQIKIYGATANDNVVIGKKQKVNVALTESANGFKVKTADGNEVAYTVNDKNAVADLTTVAECTAADGKKNTTLTFAKTGTAAYAGTYTDTLTFTVSLGVALINVNPTSVSVSAPNSAIVGVGLNKTLTATVSPNDATNKSVTWSSSNPAIATVDTQTGEVTGVAQGTVQITATTINGISATCTVTVNPVDQKSIPNDIRPSAKINLQVVEGYTWQEIVNLNSSIIFVRRISTGATFISTHADRNYCMRVGYNPVRAGDTYSNSTSYVYS